MARKLEQTASPARNFTLTTAERVQAIVTGLPAWARRLKRIEELSAAIVEAHRAGTLPGVRKQLAELVTLVDTHNAYYPMEANLPLDPETSRVMDGGEPWKPMPRPTLESLLAAAQRAEGLEGPSSLAWSDTPDVLSVTFEREDHTITLRLDAAALSCTVDGEEIARLATPTIEELAADETLNVLMRDNETIAIAFTLERESSAT